MPKRPFALLLLLGLTSACVSEPGETDRGGVTADDARALDDAAQQLDSENELKETRQRD
mgnify:CR=1 FL=1|jgi:hypothetical protein